MWTVCHADNSHEISRQIFFGKKLEMYQYNKDAPAQGPSSRGNKHLAKNVKLKRAFS